MATQTSEREGRESEVSTFALDVFWASGRTGNVPLENHVAGCERCRAYLASLDALGAASVPPVTERAVRPATRRRWALPAAASALAVAAGVALFAGGRAQEESPGTAPYVGVKGTPAVQLLVHRDRETRIWDGRSPVRAGDALALRVACEGLKRVTVAAPGTSGWGRLSSAECPSHDDPLPFTLLVNDEPGAEKLAVVLTRGEIDDDELGKAIAESRRAADAWVVTFVLPKETEINR